MEQLVMGGYPIGRVGPLLADMFLGSSGDRLLTVGVKFIKNQMTTIEELKRSRRNDVRLDQLLTELELHESCRRLQLHHLVLGERGRLVRYPLLLTQIGRLTDRADREESSLVSEAAKGMQLIVGSIDQQFPDNPAFLPSGASYCCWKMA
jgi:hypothetical protein